MKRLYASCNFLPKNPNNTSAKKFRAKPIIERGAKVDRSAIIEGGSVIKSGAEIGAFCVIESSTIGRNTRVIQSRIENSIVGENTTIGPFAYIRQDSKIGDKCRVGDFVEIKNSALADGVKAAHLAYIGDAEIGVNTNVGCGAVFANYNGKIKQRITVGSSVFIGCNVNLVAPLDVGDSAYIAAGTTVTKDVPEETFVIGRSREIFKEKRKE